MELNNRVFAIKQEVKKQKISYETLSLMSGIPLNTLKNIFRGKSQNPRIDTIEAIEQALGFTYKKTPIADVSLSENIKNCVLPLSEKEITLLEEFRGLLPEMQDLVITMMKNLHSEKVKI